MRDEGVGTHEQVVKVQEADLGAACLHIPPIIRKPAPYRDMKPADTDVAAGRRCACGRPRLVLEQVNSGTTLWCE